MNINKTRVGIFAIILAFLILFSISASSAASSYSDNGFTVTDNNADVFTQLSANKGIQTIEKNKVPKKWKAYESYTFQVAKGKKIKYKASINSAGDIIVSNLKNMKVSSATINFGDGTKKKTTGWISHTYKKTGWYFITVNLNGSCKGYDYLAGGKGLKTSGKIINATKIYLVKVTDAPQLSLSKSQPITAGYYSQKSYRKGTIDYLVIKVANLGSKTSKATKISMWYQKSGDKNIGKIHPKLKKYTASAKLKALKPGKSAKIILRFKIPKKYSKIVKNLRLGTSSLKQISKRDALYVIN